MVSPTQFDQLVDDAALFPPGNAPMARALAGHATHRASPYAGLIGPFLAPASRVDELRAVLPPDQHLRLSLVFDVSGDGAHQALRGAWAEDRVTLVAVEAAYARLGDDAVAVGANLARSAHVTGFLEVPRTDFGTALDMVGRPGWHAAKYRTGGTTAEDFPTEVELAAFLVAATTRAIPFKLTAGLHHAVRNTAEDTGLEQHGVLNVLVATRVAQQGSGLAEVATVLAGRRPEPLVEFVRAWDDSTGAAVRQAFRSFGCCGVTDPIDELAALGLVDGRG